MTGGTIAWIVGGVVCLLLVILIVWVISMYNRLVRQRNQVDASWAQIDVQLKRRTDLIPNLVETVKGYAAHERGTLDAVIQARNGALAAANADPVTRAAATTLTIGASCLGSLTAEAVGVRSATNTATAHPAIRMLPSAIMGRFFMPSPHVK